MNFYTTVKNGLPEQSGFDRFMSHLISLDGEVEIRVRPTKDIRTLKMNNLYWGWLTLISNETGYLKRELHNYFKTKLLCVEEKFLDEFVINCGSTSDLSIKDFSIYLEGVARLTSENFHIVLPDSKGLVF